MYPTISYRERVNRNNPVPLFDGNAEVDLIEPYQETENGVVIPRVRCVSKRPESPSNLTVNDFRFENLQAVGADKGLKEFKPVDDLHSFEESIVNLEEKIDNLDNAKTE